MKNFIQNLKALPGLKENNSAATIDVSLIIPARSSASSTLARTVGEADRFFRNLNLGFEIILVPNPAPGDQLDRSLSAAEDIAKSFPSVKVCPHSGPVGKGAAIRSGFSIARGQWILFTDADLPYDLVFFEKALQKLAEGDHLVSGNRRLPESIFDVPVQLLPLAYGRHRLGLEFNRIVRLLLPIKTTDTQAGIKAISRTLANEAFKRQICPGFLFDLEIFLTARNLGYSQSELPVKLYLNSEKSTVRILRESLLVAYWLTRLSWRNWNHRYGKRTPEKILQRYRKAPLSTRFFLFLRWVLTPYRKMIAHLPKEGTILDLGCGHGLFSLKAALDSPSRKMVGIDHDGARIQEAVEATSDLENIQLSEGQLGNPPTLAEPIAGIAMIDVMHYFDSATQENLIQKSFSLLEPGGKLLIREVNPEGGIPALWNRFYEKLATGLGFTRSEKKQLCFRTIPGWKSILNRNGFQVRSERCTHPLFADVLYICERPKTQNLS